MSKINDFLSEAKVFYLATIDGDRPRIRPIGAHIELDGEVIFEVGDFKEVYKQMLVNPKVEIVAYKTDGHWMRYSGTAVFETDPKYTAAMLRSFPHLAKIYNEESGNKMACFHLENATALDIAVMGEGVDML